MQNDLGRVEHEIDNDCVHAFHLTPGFFQPAMIYPHAGQSGAVSVNSKPPMIPGADPVNQSQPTSMFTSLVIDAV